MLRIIQYIPIQQSIQIQSCQIRQKIQCMSKINTYSILRLYYRSLYWAVINTCTIRKHTLSYWTSIIYYIPNQTISLIWSCTLQTFIITRQVSYMDISNQC
ncbi:unnamed protein product [Paramecium sonneborni]|uniref:Uncharacterized protein n=1 Tax=Paramecium sonneborni TaxID=65129 RepID=A0A8S1LB22_9CILI|nr:unnamed protein product [Paramecium sonneborni]